MPFSDGVNDGYYHESKDSVDPPLVALKKAGIVADASLYCLVALLIDSQVLQDKMKANRLA